MACGCGRARKSTPQNPIVFGDPTGAPVKLQATITLPGMRPRQVAWVDGTQVPTMIESKWLQTVPDDRSVG